MVGWVNIVGYIDRTLYKTHTHTHRQTQLCIYMGIVAELFTPLCDFVAVVGSGMLFILLACSILKITINTSSNKNKLNIITDFIEF
jgi:hypothetical protein